MGKKLTETLRYTTQAGEPIEIPVATVEGDRPGPVAVITAGIHGCEYPGIAGAIRLFKELDPTLVRGTVKIVTICSVGAFEARQMFVSPVDGVNINRVFPGDEKGGYSEALAFHLMKIIATGDYHIDLHGGDMVEDLEPFSIYHRGESKELDRKSYEITKYYGLPNIVSTVTDGAWPDNGTTYANAATKAKIPSAIVEAGAVGQLDEPSVAMHVEGLYNVLRHFGNLPGEPEEPAGQEIFSDMVWVFSSYKGFFHIAVKAGDRVEKGQTVGRVEDYFGNLLEMIVAPVSGKALFTTSSPAVKEKGLLMGIGVK